MTFSVVRVEEARFLDSIIRLYGLIKLIDSTNRFKVEQEKGFIARVLSSSSTESVVKDHTEQFGDKKEEEHAEQSDSKLN